MTTVTHVVYIALARQVLIPMDIFLPKKDKFHAGAVLMRGAARSCNCS